MRGGLCQRRNDSRLEPSRLASLSASPRVIAGYTGHSHMIQPVITFRDARPGSEIDFPEREGTRCALICR